MAADAARMLSTAAWTAKETDGCGRIAGALATAAKSCRRGAAGPHASRPVEAGLPGTGREADVGRSEIMGPFAASPAGAERLCRSLENAGQAERGRRTPFRQRGERAGRIRRRGDALAPTPPLQRSRHSRTLAAGSRAGGRVALRGQRTAPAPAAWKGPGGGAAAAPTSSTPGPDARAGSSRNASVFGPARAHAAGKRAHELYGIHRTLCRSAPKGCTRSRKSGTRISALCRRGVWWLGWDRRPTKGPGGRRAQAG